MNDMSSVITPKSDQINADDLISGPMTITIREVQIRAGQDQPVSMFFDGSNKAFRPCKSMSRVLVAVWGPDAAKYIGRSLTLYRDPNVKWGGMKVGGIRISHMTHLEEERIMALTETKGSRKPYKIQPLKTETRQPDQRIIDGVNTLIERIKAVGYDEAVGGDPAALKQIGWLRDNHPDLAKRIDDAIASHPSTAECSPARNDGEALQQSAGVEAADTQEGRSDEQHGDQHDGTEGNRWDADVADWTERLSRASIVGDILSVRADFDKQRDFLPDDVVSSVEASIDAARARLGVK